MSLIPLTTEDIVFRLFLTLFLAGIIGFDRERLRKPAGIRTHIMVALGGALLMMISIFTSPVVGGLVQFDPRIVANVVTGIGFLGAGTILHMREGIVTGLTTAATLWIVSAIGMAVGCGFYTGAAVSTAFVMLVLYAMGMVDDYLEGRVYQTLTLHAKMTHSISEEAKALLRSVGIKVFKAEAQTISPAEKYVVIHFKPIKVSKVKSILPKLSRLHGVKEASFN
jgi:putative Mg2+ transporter-C (MgtC) family protein